MNTALSGTSLTVQQRSRGRAMIILLGIVAIHLLVIVRAKWTPDDTPYFSIFMISMMLVGFVMYMLVNMEPPTP